MSDMNRLVFTLREGPIHILPILHERLEFAEAARGVLENLRPKAVAVELPASLQAQGIRAVKRLPRISVLVYEARSGNPLYWVCSPADPLVEGIRWALEHRVPVHFVDVDVDAPMQWHEHLPDPYAILRLGLKSYYEEVMRSGLLERSDPRDRLRERGMAFRLRRLAAGDAPVLLICGMAHAERILTDLKGPLAEPLDRPEREVVQIFHLHPESLPEVLWDPPLIHALYEFRRRGLPVETDSQGMDREGVHVGPFRVLQGGRPPDGSDWEEVRKEAVRWCARRCHQRTPEETSEEALPLDLLLHVEGKNPPPDAHRLPMDRQRVLWRWLQQAARIYRRRTGEKLQPWQVRHLMRFSRNYALLESRLLPDFFQWVAAARSCVDEGFAYEVWALGCVYPWQREVVEDFPTIRLQAEDLMLGTRRMKIRPRIPRRRRPRRFPVRQRRRETRPGEWLEAFDGEALCSYPPEDLVVERFGDYLRAKGVRILSEDQSRVEPFVSSLLDGIDLRETLRNWHEGKIYVREMRRVRGGVGSVVVIFDPDPDGDRYPYCMTWHGEHDQESDMAFYATPLGARIVGPGISRCEYGGFVMTYPPRRMYDIWRDPAYSVLDTKPEVLLMAALEYSLEPYVVYVAAYPPRSWFHTLAGRMGLKIVYIPLGQISPSTLKKIRVFHVLSGHDKRRIAKDYIFKD